MGSREGLIRKLGGGAAGGAGSGPNPAKVSKVYLSDGPPRPGGPVPVWRACDLVGSDDGGDTLHVVDFKGEKARRPRKDCLTYSEDAARGAPDLISLDVLHEASIQHCLQARSKQGLAYTYVGSVLVVMNPYESFPVYNLETMQRYAAAGARGREEPHVYAVAADAYKAVKAQRHSQSIVICGESGSGKTEATKHILGYLSSMDQQAEQTLGASRGGDVRRVILESNPALEAFGNAKTVRNDNSSRFGKFFQVLIDGEGHIAGGSVTAYLLEKSRVVVRGEGERNFHVFYQLCEGASAEQRKAYGLRAAGEFRYLKGSPAVPGVKDGAELAHTLQALGSVGASESDVDGILRVLSAILHLGNIEFEALGSPEDAGGALCEVRDKAPLQQAASLLGLDAGALEEALVTRCLTTPSSRVRKASVYKLPTDAAEAASQRDALAKVMYERMFEWLVGRVSNTMAPVSQDAELPSVGVLDIFGFEVFKTNSFEQLCINYANEKLHRLFQRTALQEEMALYEREGLMRDQLKVSFEDNSGTLAALEAKGSSVLACLQAQSQLKNGTDAAFHREMVHQLNKKPCFKAGGPEDFTLLHYAGPVRYESDGFLQKDRDALAYNLEELLGAVKHAGVAGVLRVEAASKGKSISQRFTQQLGTLVKALEASTQHYVRCIKPNPDRKARTVDEGMVASQLSCSGTLELARLRREGYSIRVPIPRFVQEHRLLVRNNEEGMSDRELARKVLELTLPGPHPEDTARPYQIGHDLVFLKDEPTRLTLERHMEEQVEKLLLSQITQVQRFMRGCHVRRVVVPRQRRAKLEQDCEKERKRQMSIMASLQKMGSPIFKAVQAAGGLGVLSTSAMKERVSAAAARKGSDGGAEGPSGQGAAAPAPPPARGGAKQTAAQLQALPTAELVKRVMQLEEENSRLRASLSAALSRADSSEAQLSRRMPSSASPDSVSAAPRPQPSSPASPSAPLDPSNPIRSAHRYSVRDLDRTGRAAVGASDMMSRAMASTGAPKAVAAGGKGRYFAGRWWSGGPG